MLRSVLVVIVGLFLSACGGAKTDASQESSSSVLPQQEEQQQVIEEYIPEVKEVKTEELQIIYFAFDVFSISKEMFNAINANAEILKRNPEVKIVLEGNTDAYGSDEYNFALGNKRALAVKEALIVRGISKDRISTVSYGETKPVCTELTKECRAKNRRVNFVLEK